MPEEQTNSIEAPSSIGNDGSLDLTDESVDPEEIQSTTAPPGGKLFNEDPCVEDLAVAESCSGENISQSIECSPVLPAEITDNDYLWLTTQMDNAVQQLSQKYRNNDNTLLDSLNNQIDRLDKEIASLTDSGCFQNDVSVSVINRKIKRLL